MFVPHVFVPHVPIVPHSRTTVINKTIVYSDTVLPLKDVGENLKVTTICNVSESALESCLKKVFEANPGVVFNTVQYSKNNNKVYFYTDKNISTKEYEESKYYIYKPITSSAEILKEIKTVLSQDKNVDSSCVSLFVVSNLLNLEEKKYKDVIKNYEVRIKELLSAHNTKSELIIYDFDYDKEELRIGYGKYYDKICFMKKDGDLYITKSESFYADDVLAIAGSELSNLYDEFLKFKKYKEESNYGFKAVNSNFLVNVSQYGVGILAKNPNNYFSNDFELQSYSYIDKIKCSCNSTAVLSALTGHEKEILKRIYVNINDCPLWMRTALQEVRNEQLSNDRRIEEENKRLEEKKQKRLEFKRKIFPWLKK